MKNTRTLTLIAALLALFLAACRTAEFSQVQDCLAAQSTLQVGNSLSSSFTGRLLVGYSPAIAGTSLQSQAELRAQQALALSQDHGLELLETRSGPLPDLLRTNGDPQEAARQLRQDPRVDYAVADFTLQLLEGIDCHQDQWNMSNFGVPEAWGRGPGRHRVVVAVIDSGIDVDHPELAPAMLPGFNFNNMTNDPRPVLETDNHGTHVAGIVAARGLEEGSVTGVAGFPDHIKVLPIRIFNDQANSASFDDLVRAIAWAAGEDVPGTPDNPNRANVINLSLGARLPPQPGVDEAISRIVDRHGITVIAAAGNLESPGSQDVGIYAPANSAAALAVGSVNSDARLSWFSVYGGPSQITVTAPGGSGPSRCGRVLSTVPFGELGCAAGTSMSAPFVSGAVALLLTHQPRLGPDQIEQRLRTATWFDAEFMSADAYGAGVLCVNRLLAGSVRPTALAC